MDTADWYRFFADVEAKDSSPSYHVLASGVADDEILLGRLELLPVAERQPNLLFAAVQFLGGPTSEWGAFRSLYFVADLVAPPSPSPNAFVLGLNGTEFLAHTDPHGTWLRWTETMRRPNRRCP